MLPHLAMCSEPLNSLGLGPVERVSAGRGILISSVPATPQEMGERLVLVLEGLNILAGVELPMTCQHPVVWVTNRIYQTPQPQ